MASECELLHEERLKFEKVQKAAREDVQKLRVHADDDVAEKLQAVELMEKAIAACEEAALARAKDLDLRASQLDSDQAQFQTERDFLQVTMDADKGQSKKLEEATACLSSAQEEIFSLKGSLTNLQTELDNAAKLRQTQADRVRSVNS
jgi:hypothetical protein